MSVEAITWAMDNAPMLRTVHGRPDTTARHVLAALAEHANRHGRNAHPSLARIQYRTGYDRRTVQRALRRLEAGELIAKDGVVDGRTRWRLALELQRPDSDWKQIEAEEEAERAAAAERKRKSRAKGVTHSDDVTVTDAECVTDPAGNSTSEGESDAGHGRRVRDEADVTDSASGRHALSVRDKGDVTHSASGRHARSAALTVINHQTDQPSEQPTSQPRAHDDAPVGISDGIPDDARPLVHAIHHAGLPGLRWDMRGDDWAQILVYIRAKGVPAMADHAARAAASASRPISSARYFLAGWKSLPNQPPPGATPRGPATVRNGGTDTNLAGHADLIDQLRAEQARAEELHARPQREIR
ncbi:helix-turn-helix domain-containing protein [Spirillospora sp. CA-253888]